MYILLTHFLFLNIAYVHEASLMQGWVRTSRVLALAEHDNNHALFVFMSSRMPPQLFSDLAIERVLPVDADFRCEIGEYVKSCCFGLCVRNALCSVME
jgi:hypothetical protein